MGIFDSLQLKKRLESAASDAGKSIIAAVTPKSPVPLSLDGAKAAAGKYADTKLAEGEKKAKSKAKDLEKATVGKVGAAVQTKIDNAATKVESKIDETLAAAEGTVDKGIARVGTTVDGGIAAVDKEIDKAGAKAERLVSGKPKKAAAPAAAPKAEADEAKAEVVAETATTKAEPDDAGVAPVIIGRQRANAVTAKPEAAKPEVAADPATEPAADPAATEAKTDGEPAATPAAAATEPAAATAAETEPEIDHDLDGAAAAAAEERKQQAGGANDTEITDEDASEFDQVGDSPDAPGDAPVPDAPAAGEDVKGAENESGEDLTDAEIEQLVKDGEVTDAKDQLSAKRNYKKKIREINGQLASTLGGGLATGAGSTKDPWVAYFIASAKFRKKLAARDLREELAGNKKDDDEKATEPEAAATEDDVKDEPTAEDEPGRESTDRTEVEIRAGLVYRSEKSPTQSGDAADTTDPEIGSAKGRQIWVADKTNKIYLAYRPIEGDDHTQLLGADDIAVGGEVRIEAGKIDFLSNDRRGDQETPEPFVALLRALREQKVPMNFEVFEASDKSETTAEDLLEAADKAEPEPEDADLIAVMKSSDAWKAIAADFSEKAIADVAEAQKWTLVSGSIVDATGAEVDPAAARELLQQHVSKNLAAEAAAQVAARAAAKEAAVGG